MLTGILAHGVWAVKGLFLRFWVVGCRGPSLRCRARSLDPGPPVCYTSCCLHRKADGLLGRFGGYRQRMARKQGQNEHTSEDKPKKSRGRPTKRVLDAAAQATLAVPRVDIEAPPGITDVFSESGFVQVVVDCSSLQSTSLNRVDIYEALASEGISVALPQIYEDQISLVMKVEDLERARDTLEEHMHLGCRVTDGLALVTARAVDMRALAGVMSRARAALLRAGIDPVQVGDSHASLFVLVAASEAETALKAWRKEFQLEGGPKP